ncbi:hypothetical protein CG736_04665 [Kitasatospora sp. CB02891]|nr:hypothetical protein CG736_04665 [Kitasatospora sp. CB02891]
MGVRAADDVERAQRTFAPGRTDLPLPSAGRAPPAMIHSFADRSEEGSTMSRNPKLLALIGPLLMLVAVLMGWSNIQARIDFADAPRVRATVLTADYREARSSTARDITLGVPEPVPLDDIRTAPGGLVPGATVTALVRPGHALLPAQLSWSTLILPVFLAALGLAGTVIGVCAIRADPPTGPTDPEAWF